MAISYDKTTWQNGVTPVNETNMNNIERGIVDCVEAINSGSGGTITVDDALSATSENPVQNKVINTALGGKIDKISTTEGFWYGKLSGASQIDKTDGIIDFSPGLTEKVAMSDDVYNFVHGITDNKLDAITITLTGATSEARKTEFLTKIRSNFTADTAEIKLFFVNRALRYTQHVDAGDGYPEYDLVANITGFVAVLHSSDNSMYLQGILQNYPSMSVTASNDIDLIYPSPLPTITYNTTSQPYRSVALNTMKLYVADAPDTISAVADNACTFDFSKGQMLTANVEVSADTTVTFGVDGNNNAKYVGRTISACITNTSTSAACTITFASPTAITRMIGVDGGSADSLSVPALKTVKLNVTLLKDAAGFVAYIEYKQIN